MLMQAIGAFLPAAVAVALSPIPIVGVIVILGTPKARTNGPAFAVGWVVGLTLVMAVVLVATSGASDPDSTAATGVNWTQVAFGLLFLAMAARKWRGRPKAGEEAEAPSWLATIDQTTPAKANLALTASAAATISTSGLQGGDELVAAAIFVILGSVTVAGSVLFFLVAPSKAAGPLASAKEFMAAHNAVIMMVILVLLGVKLLGDGLAGAAG
jgi:threonine/homoserine/homoserine lactone efflux protein